MKSKDEFKSVKISMIVLFVYIFLLSTCVFFLSGCFTMKDVPLTEIYVVDTSHNVCARRVITDKRTLSSKWIGDLPLEACDGNVSIKMKEFLDLRTFLKNHVTND